MHSPDVGEAVVVPSAQYNRMVSALRFIADQQDLTFAECSLAEEIIARAKEALA